MARQGHSFATAQNVRVVYPQRHENDQELIDVPKNGTTVGEVVTRGNIVMKEVGDGIHHVVNLYMTLPCGSTLTIRKLPTRHSEGGTSILVTLQ